MRDETLKKDEEEEDKSSAYEYCRERETGVGVVEGRRMTVLSLTSTPPSHVEN